MAKIAIDSFVSREIETVSTKADAANGRWFAIAIFGFALCGFCFLGAFLLIAFSGFGLIPKTSLSGFWTIAMMISAFIFAVLGAHARDIIESNDKAKRVEVGNHSDQSGRQ